jgi:hypothetical protein
MFLFASPVLSEQHWLFDATLERLSKREGLWAEGTGQTETGSGAGQEQLWSRAELLWAERELSQGPVMLA